MLKSYLKNIFEVAKRGDSTENSYYSCLEELLKNYSESINKKHIQTTTLPKKTDAGNPDFRIWDGKQHIVGYIEAKAPTVEHLDQIKETEQLKRYLHTFPNLILTNFFEFRLYRDGNLIDKIQIARPYVIHKLGTIPPVENENDFLNLLEKFFSFSLPRTYTAKTLAMELAKRTRFLKEQVIIEELKQEEKKGKGNIFGFYQAFQKFLIHGLTHEDFADLYSQTITYGLFAARTRFNPPIPPLEKGGEGGFYGFNRRLAFDYIPQTIGILRDVFKFISLEDLPPQMEWIVDDISEVLSAADVKQILHKFYHEGKGSDPIIHFYETFLAEYDPETREKRGVYYTPEPVVSYIARSLHHILKEHFNRKDGFANTSVTVLDPAAGTLTFLAETSKLAVEEFTSKYGEGGKKDLIKTHILKNYYAFELMMAPYAVGHLKMSFLLEELGYKLQKEDRFKLYLTNTLEMEDLEQTFLPGMASLSEESHLAGKVKKEQPILAILGNPPYSGHSTNIGEWITKEIKAYFQVDGKPLGEKNPKWLQDDYVKFIRFAQWKIDTAGEGVLGFITNHSYLDNPTFRGMRQSLMQSFDEIYFLDLHGNSLKKEKCPDGSKDENVFDIQQGVAIALFIKKKTPSPSPLPYGERDSTFSPLPHGERIKVRGCKISHSDLWGLREDKYHWLNKHDITTTKWKRLKPKSEFYLFIPREEKLLKVYENYPKITDIFPVNSVGIVTARDKLTIKWTQEEMWQTVLNFSRLDVEIARQAYNLGRDVRDWKVELAQKDLKDSGMDKNKIVPILYRPFDIRYTYYTGKSRGFHCMPRPEVMQHMMHENLGLVTARQMDESGILPAFIRNTIIDAHSITSAVSISYLFPLYLYQKRNPPSPPFGKGGKGGFASSVMMLFEPEAEYAVKKPNLNPAIVEELKKNFKLVPNKKRELTPEQIFHYIYAVLYSNIYRTKYAEFLKIDFPRIPFAKDYKLFCKMVEYGERLVNLHLLKSSELDSPVAKFQGKGNNRVEKLRYNPPHPPFSKGGMGGFARLFINSDQYFEGIVPEVYEYQIGGYQVLEKWLKDRKGRTLSLEEIKHYCRVAASIQKTIEIQKEIDDSYLKVEENKGH